MLWSPGAAKAARWICNLFEPIPMAIKPGLSPFFVVVTTNRHAVGVPRAFSHIAARWAVSNMAQPGSA